MGFILFNRNDPQQVHTAYTACESLLKNAAVAGYGAYSSHLNFMDLVADRYDFNGHALRRVNDALDPNGILAPGEQGIWPSERVREES